MQNKSNGFHAQATERLFLAVVNQAISDVRTGKKQKKQSDGFLARTLMS